MVIPSVARGLKGSIRAPPSRASCVARGKSRSRSQTRDTKPGLTAMPCAQSDHAASTPWLKVRRGPGGEGRVPRAGCRVPGLEPRGPGPVSTAGFRSPKAPSPEGPEAAPPLASATAEWFLQSDKDTPMPARGRPRVVTSAAFIPRRAQPGMIPGPGTGTQPGASRLESSRDRKLRVCRLGGTVGQVRRLTGKCRRLGPQVPGAAARQGQWTRVDAPGRNSDNMGRD